MDERESGEGREGVEERQTTRKRNRGIREMEKGREKGRKGDR